MQEAYKVCCSISTRKKNSYITQPSHICQKDYHAQIEKKLNETVVGCQFSICTFPLCS